MKIWIVLLAFVMSMPAHADESFKKVFECMRANLPPSLRAQEIEIISTDRAGAARTLKGKLYAKKDNGLMRVMLRIVEPFDLAGASYLMRETKGNHEDDIYLSLPRMERVRHITGATAGQSLLGTDFSYADIKQIQIAFAGVNGKLETPEAIDKRAVNVMTISPTDAKGSPYSSIRAWVDQETCVALKAEFYDGEKLRKQLTVPAAALVQSGKYWYPSEIQMRDIREGTNTVLKLKNFKPEKDLSSVYFNPTSFNIGG